MLLRLKFIPIYVWALVMPLLASAAPSITISPGYTNLGLGQSLQYTATVTGLANTTVKWEVNSVVGGSATLGTITQAGLYQSPATLPKGSLLIEALGSDNSTLGVVYVNVEPAGPAITAIAPNPIHTGNYAITLTGAGFQSGAVVIAAGINLTTKFVNATTLTATGYQSAAQTVAFQAQNPGSMPGAAFNAPFTSATPQTISPTSAQVSLGATKQFTSSGATTWTATAGSVSMSGLYQAPLTMPSSPTVQVTATGPNGSAIATVTLLPAAPQTIAPLTASVVLGKTKQFTSAAATSWTATAGTISASGLFTAPISMPASPSVTITATGLGGTANATVTLIAPQTISPTTASVNLGGSQQFTSAGAVTWTATYGTVNSGGLYLAPSSLPASGADTVIATGPGGSAQAAITLIAQSPVITSVSNNGQLPLGVFSTTIGGTGFNSSSVASLNGVPLSTTLSSGSLNVVGFAGQSGPGNLTVANASVVSSPFPVQVGVQNAMVSPAAARRFLEQAAFGPTPTDATHVQTIGFQPWLAEQFAMPQISTYSAITGDQGGMPAHFLTDAVTNPDQLRQRVAFALSQIFVTSIDKLIWNANMVTYQDMLLADSFGNYRQIMEDVTLSPAMGQYLDMANNAMADPTTGSVANENYARELMQLFTIGTNMLNQDGTVKLDSQQLPIPTYSQFTVTEFARVFTGWTYGPPPGQSVQWGSYISPYPLAAYPGEHDMGSKQLLNGYVSPAGETPQQDLDNALDNIFNHPNVGPFVGTQLIQHLVKSNPSPAYVSRVAAAFNDNGNKVRGDMQATIAAVLLDPEARANDNGGSDKAGDGHLQEPALFIAAMVRAFGGQMNDQNYYATELANMGQDVFAPASVFNYYPPNYAVPGTPLLGGEFAIFSPNNAIVRANEVSSLFSQYSNAVQTYGPGTSVDLTPYLPLASTPATLVNALDLALTHGVMPAAMKSSIVTAVANDSSGQLHRVQTACYLILTSSYYNVWH